MNQIKTDTKMKAVLYHKYGSPDVLRFEEVQKPSPADDEVLVKVHASSANAGDWHLLRGTPFLIRLMGNGVLKPKHKILGADIAGRVEAAGRNVTQFQAGDEVFGDISEAGYGVFAEYVCVPESTLALKPTNMRFEEAATVPAAAVTALQGLRDKGRIQQGQRVLVNGASGGVGTFAVQIAKSFGAEVTGVCSTRNLDMVRSIGADHVIDYTQEDFTKSEQKYDLILDAAAYRSLSEYERILEPEGTYVLVGGSAYKFFQAMLFGSWRSRSGGKKMGILEMKPNHRDLVFIRELIEAGKIVPVVDRRYTLNDTAEAIRYLEKGHARGKAIMTVSDESSDVRMQVNDDSKEVEPQNNALARS